jgi:alkanesulfonate monooxygenase SsuD/methylene tetrahydromethanopterin reductase-like flavin-dependent oxidoreductase (luciferase family)
VGTDFGAITRSANFNVIIGETENDVADKLAWVRAHYEPLVPAESVESYMALLSSGPLVGTPEQIVERLAEARDLGLAYAIGYFVDAAYDSRSIDLFAAQVIPALAD